MIQALTLEQVDADDTQEKQGLILDRHAQIGQTRVFLAQRLQFQSSCEQLPRVGPESWPADSRDLGIPPGTMVTPD